MYTLEDFNIKDRLTKNKILNESNVVCCGRCEREFVVAKTATATHCPFCGKELGKLVKTQIETYFASGIIPFYIPGT